MASASPAQVQEVPAYLSLNAGLFDSTQHWSYNDLRRLAKKLGLSGAGSRAQIVERLSSWHREQREHHQAGKFHSVEVRACPDGQPISPRLLSPLVNRASGNGILNTSRRSSNGSSCSPLKASGRSNVLFSPYNMVKLIPSKEHSEMYGRYREPTYNDSLFDDDEESTSGDENEAPIPHRRPSVRYEIPTNHDYDANSLSCQSLNV